MESSITLRVGDLPATSFPYALSANALTMNYSKPGGFSRRRLFVETGTIIVNQTDLPTKTFVYGHSDRHTCGDDRDIHGPCDREVPA
jgi:hypothetical protein